MIEHLIILGIALAVPLTTMVGTWAVVKVVRRPKIRYKYVEVITEQGSHIMREPYRYQTLSCEINSDEFWDHSKYLTGQTFTGFTYEVAHTKE